MITVLDINNFWSPSGGGVRRYHLEKMTAYGKRSDVQLVFLAGGSEDRMEQKASNVFMEYRQALRFPGNWDYRYLFDPSIIAEVIQKWRPDVIEIGSPYLLPQWVRLAILRAGISVKVTGFWHADFPVTYVRRFLLDHVGPKVAQIGESVAWWYARREYGWLDATLVSSHEVMDRMRTRGLKSLSYVPLGVDTERFHPGKRDDALRSELHAGDPARPILFFPHRFCQEKGIQTLLSAWPKVIAGLGKEPALVFAGTGPDLDLVEDACRIYQHTRYIGYVTNPDEMARWQATADCGVALSGWETFGLSILEALASGQQLVGADTGAAAEHVQGVGGQIVQTGELNQLAKALILLFTQLDQPASRARAREYAERFSWESCFERQVKLYHELVNC